MGTDLEGPGFPPRGSGAGGGDSPAVTPQHPPCGAGGEQQLGLSLLIYCLSDHSLPEKDEFLQQTLGSHFELIFLSLLRFSFLTTVGKQQRQSTKAHRKSL